MKINAIVAASENNVIGVGQEIPWHLPNDFRYFKKITTGFPIIMGKNTWLTFPKPLPNRLNVVISTSIKTDELPDGVLNFNSIDDALDNLSQIGYKEIFIIGGGKLYEATLSLCDTIYLTRVHTNIENGTAFFPNLSSDIWKLTASTFNPADERHAYNYTFEVYNRK